MPSTRPFASPGLWRRRLGRRIPADGRRPRVGRRVARRQRQCDRATTSAPTSSHDHARVRPHARPEARPRDQAQRRPRPEFNNNEFSVMTYASYTGAPFDRRTADVDGSSPQSYMMFDISALQSMYGANFSRLGSRHLSAGTERPASRRSTASRRPTPASAPPARSSRPCGRRAPPRPTTSAPSARTRSTTSGPAIG